MLTNYTLISNTQSKLEIEVWKWNSDNEIDVKTGRQYLPDFVKDHKGEQPHLVELTNLINSQNKERIYRERKDLFKEYKVMKTFYEFPKQDNRDENIEEQK